MTRHLTTPLLLACLLGAGCVPIWRSSTSTQNGVRIHTCHFELIGMKDGPFYSSDKRVTETNGVVTIEKSSQFW